MNVYNEGNISTTVVNYFDDISTRHIGKDYIVARISQYEYIGVYGNIEYANNTYTYNECDVYLLNAQNQYNTTYQLRHSIDSDTIYNPNSNIVYSSLGYMPMLTERGEIYDGQTLFILVLFALGYLFAQFTKRLC